LSKILKEKNATSQVFPTVYNSLYAVNESYGTGAANCQDKGNGSERKRREYAGCYCTDE
jgi:hypothetical protein